MSRELVRKGTLNHDDIVPPRLRGKEIRVYLDRDNKKLEFEADIPDDPTKQELGLVELLIGEYVDELRERFPNMIGYTSSKKVINT